MKKIFIYSIFLLLPGAIKAQQKNKTENIVIVTLDGMRWQEIFGGADQALLTNKKFTRDSTETTNKFWSDGITERRKKLFPFLWSTIAEQGP